MTRRLLIALGSALLIVVRVDGQTTGPASRKSGKGLAEGDTRRGDVHGAGRMDADDQGSVVVLDAPEGDTHLVIVDVTAKDADAAVAAGWAAYKPDFKRPLKISLPQAPRDGWEERKAIPVRDIAERAGRRRRLRLARRRTSGPSSSSTGPSPR